MISQLLRELFNKNIEIYIDKDKLKLRYEDGKIDPVLKEDIKDHKQVLIKRLKENYEAKEIGFCVYNHGDLYEYRYGFGSFLYIERLTNEKASAWRTNYIPDSNKPYKQKIIANNVPFKRAFQDSLGFINWLKKQKKNKAG